MVSDDYVDFFAFLCSTSLFTSDDRYSDTFDIFTLFVEREEV